MTINMLIINIEKQIPRAETKSEERNQDQEIRRKQDQRREVTELRKLDKSKKKQQTHM